MKKNGGNKELCQGIYPARRQSRLPPDRPELCRAPLSPDLQLGTFGPILLLSFSELHRPVEVQTFLNLDTSLSSTSSPQENWKRPWVCAGVPPNLSYEAPGSWVLPLLPRCGDWP